MSEVSLAPMVRQSINADIEVQAVELILQSLPVRTRKVLEMRFLQGFKVAQIATELSMAIDIVEATVRQGIATIKSSRS